MAQSRYVPDKRSNRRKVQDAFIKHEATPDELSDTIKLLIRRGQRELISSIRMNRKELASLYNQLKKHQDDPARVRILATRIIRQKDTIAKLQHDHDELGNRKNAMTQYTAMGIKSELVRIQGMLVRSVAQNMNPAHVMRQQQATMQDQMHIEVSEQYIDTANSGLAGQQSDYEVEELSEEMIQRILDEAGLKTRESFSGETAVPNAPALSTDDAYLNSRIQQLNRM